MKKIFEKNGIVLLLVSLIILNILPQIICAFMVTSANYFISTSDVATANILSYLISYIVFVLGISSYFNTSKIKSMINALPIVIGYIAILIISSLLNSNILWISVIEIIISAIISTISILVTIYNLTEKKIDNKIKLILLSLLGVVFFIIPEIACGFFTTINMNNLFIQSIINGFLYGVILWLLLIVYINIIESKLDKEYKKLKDIIFIGVTVVLVLVSFIINTDKTNNVKSINNMISYSLASGDYAFDEMDIMTAKSFYNEGKEFKCAYEYVVDENYDTRGCSGELFELFKTLKKEDAITTLKDKVNKKQANIYDMEALMVLMKENNDKDLKKFNKYLISNMHFTRTTILPFDLTDSDKEELKEKLKEYDKHITLRRYIDIYVEWLKQGEINDSVINVATSLAREYPEELGILATTIKFYVNTPVNLTGDSSVVDNFVNLTKDEILKKSDEEIIAYKTYIAYAYKKCNASNKVISFLEEFKPDLISSDLGSLLIVSYKKAYKHDKAEEIALKTLEKDEYNVDALSYLSIYKLQSDLDASVEYAVKLSTVIRDKKENYLVADMALGLYRTYLIGYYESPDSTFCPYHNFFNDMSETQQLALTNNEIINAYFIGRNLNEENIEEFNKIIEKYNYVSYYYYYRAVYEMKNNKYEDAVKDLEKAIELGNEDPFFYSELGFAYEGVGDLQKSLKAFEIASTKVDEYGLGGLTYNYNNIHNYFNVYINNAKHAMYESEGDHDE